MNDEPGWGDLVQELEKIKATQRLSADWLAYVGSEDYGVWLLRPGDANADESRAAFSLIAAHIIAKLAIPPIPVPQPLEYCPHWKMSCNAEEESVRKEGKELDLSDAVPYGLDKVDLDAVDPCTRALLELLRRESRGFRISSNGTDWIKGTAYPAVTGTIEDLCGTTAAYIKRRARDEIEARLRKPAAKADLKVNDSSSVAGEAAVNENHTESEQQDIAGETIAGASAGERAISDNSGGGRRRGRRAIPGRREAIRDALIKHGEAWRDHLPEIFGELDSLDVPLGDFQGMKIDLGGETQSVEKWEDLDLAIEDQRRQIIDTLRKYTDLIPK